MRGRLPLLALTALSAFGSTRSASAEIALLENGMTLKIVAWGISGGTARMRLKDGGEVGVPATHLVGVLPDEIVEQVEQEALRGDKDVATLLRAAAERSGLDPALVRAVVAVESAFRPEAVSPKGARGLMQLMPATAAALGVQDAFDPAQNLDAGARHLAALVQAYGGDL